MSNPHNPVTVVVGGGNLVTPAPRSLTSVGNLVTSVAGGGNPVTLTTDGCNPVAFIGDHALNHLTVGPGGGYSTLADAITARATLTHTLLASITANVSGTSSGTVKVQEATKASGDDLTSLVGREVYVQIDGAGPLIKMWVVSTTELFSKYYFYADLTGADFDLYSIAPAVIELLPGYRENITASTSIPSFTTLYSVQPGASTIYCTGSGTLDISDTNEVNFFGLSTDQGHNLASGLTIKADNTNLKTAMCDQLNISHCVIGGGPVDTMILDAKTGSVNVTNSLVDGVWDVLLFALPARTFLTNCPLFRSVAIDGITTSAVAMTFSAASASDYPGRTLKIEGCKVVAESYASSPTKCTAMEIKPKVALDVCQIQNNVIESHNFSGNVQVVGLQVGGNGDIDISGNLFNVSNAGATTPAPIAGDATTGYNAYTIGNRAVGDATFAANIIDALGRINAYTDTA